MDKTEVVFRKAVASDLDAILNIEQEGFTVDRFSGRQMRYLLKSSTVDFYLAEISDSIVGYMILLLRTNSQQIRIYSLAVSATVRGQGLGELFLQWAVKLAREKSMKRLKLEVRSTNVGAIKLYQRNYFTTLKVVQGYYHDGGEALMMIREL